MKVRKLQGKVINVEKNNYNIIDKNGDKWVRQIDRSIDPQKQTEKDRELGER